jgi:hypothetical protein
MASASSSAIASRNLTTPGLRLARVANRLALHGPTPAVTQRPHPWLPFPAGNNVATQCRECWGFIDDARHTTREG